MAMHHGCMKRNVPSEQRSGMAFQSTLDSGAASSPAALHRVRLPQRLPAKSPSRQSAQLQHLCAECDRCSAQAAVGISETVPGNNRNRAISHKQRVAPVPLVPFAVPAAWPEAAGSTDGAARRWKRRLQAPAEKGGNKISLNTSSRTPDVAVLVPSWLGIVCLRELKACSTTDESLQLAGGKKWQALDVRATQHNHCGDPFHDAKHKRVIPTTENPQTHK